jgi:UDP-3-O-[3-hydroxymyristoyl] glucosamine N-acyltransferase
MIGSGNPKKDMIDAINHFFPEKEIVPYVNSTAVIHKSCKLGKNLRIGPNAVIEEDVVIGDGCVIEANAVIKKGTILGKNVRIKSCSVIGGNGFGYDKDEDESSYKFLPHFGRVIIEDDVDIGSNTCIDKGSLSDTIIRKGVKIDNLVHIAHNVDIGENTLVIACSMVAGSVTIGENSWIAPAASIRNGLKIGKNCTVGLGSVLTNDIGDNSTVLGVPAVDIDDFKVLRKHQKEILKSKGEMDKIK